MNIKIIWEKKECKESEIFIHLHTYRFIIFRILIFLQEKREETDVCDMGVKFHYLDIYLIHEDIRKIIKFFYFRSNKVFLRKTLRA